MNKRMTGNAVKEAFDNLPSGVCFFNKNGIPVLCNRRMHRLVFSLTGRDLQMRSDLSDALEQAGRMEDHILFLPDGTAWQFRTSAVTADEAYTQVVASDVTAQYRQKQELEASNRKYADMVANVKRIAHNVVAITREEELLTMKMRIHSKVGLCLQRLGQCIAAEKLLQDKASVIASLREVADTLQKEIGNDDQPDAIGGLIQAAKAVGITVAFEGDPPEGSRTSVLLAHALRECVTNTHRHAAGDRVLAVLSYDAEGLTAVITNNGKIPGEEIVEGGGLSALRNRLERSGGTMTVESVPRFALKVTIPRESEEDLYA